MTDVFISYSHQDLERAERIAMCLRDGGRQVFFDRRIPTGDRWNEAIRHEINAVACVLVLWSADAVQSLWVMGEAALAAQLGKVVPVRLDDVEIPQLFNSLQTYSLAGWDGDCSDPAFEHLRIELDQVIGRPAGFANIETVGAGEAVGPQHLHLVHTSWRDTKGDAERRLRFPWQIRVIVFGHPSALDRIERVVYTLPGYPAARAEQTITAEHRDNCFMLKDLANGWSIIQARIEITGQPPGSDRAVHVERFITLHDSGPRLEPLIRAAAGGARVGGGAPPTH